MEDAIRHLDSTAPPPDMLNGKSTRRLDLWRNRIPDKWLGEVDYSDDADCRPITPGNFQKAVELTVLPKEFGVDVQAVAAALPKAATTALGKRVPSIDNAVMQKQKATSKALETQLQGKCSTRSWSTRRIETL